MLANILNVTLDEDKLYKKICEFEMMNNQNAYLFMNQETLNELAIFNELKVDVEFNKESNCIVSHYSGRRVFQNEDLKFGEIEIR